MILYYNHNIYPNGQSLRNTGLGVNPVMMRLVRFVAGMGVSNTLYTVRLLTAGVFWYMRTKERTV